MNYHKKLVLSRLFIVIALLALNTLSASSVNSQGNGYQTFLPLVNKAPKHISINFDDQNAPCGFIETVALREEYATSGVHFSGLLPLDGGGILNECGEFSVSGYSEPNFLAFNKEALYSNGGIPQTPQIITFYDLISTVSFNTGSSFEGQILTLSAFDDGDNKVAENSISLSSTLQHIYVSASGIKYVLIDCPATYFVIDDLTFTK